MCMACFDSLAPLTRGKGTRKENARKRPGKARPAPEPPQEERFAPSSIEYAELDVTTNFSFLRGASHADELMLQAARLGHRAIAVTDLNTLAGAVRMFDAARQIARTGWGPKLI